ncbi:uncharacterized protein [Spinacia oleracea]|uniref:Uncharacterized protein n=1 Tax=Spinacia oleracea TaxID=3562 RepID=A0ABM3R1A1_SPIOL|nr:uncharacterized protein LOC130464044 [Spinacia oleracea]
MTTIIELGEECFDDGKTLEEKSSCASLQVRPPFSLSQILLPLPLHLRFLSPLSSPSLLHRQRSSPNLSLVANALLSLPLFLLLIFSFPLFLVDVGLPLVLSSSSFSSLTGRDEEWTRSFESPPPPRSALPLSLIEQNIRKLIKDGFIIKKPSNIHSRSRARRMNEAKRNGRHSGYGVGKHDEYNRN